MTREEYRSQLLKRCGRCAVDTPWCSVVQNDPPHERVHWGCKIEDEWRWFLKLGMSLEEFLAKVEAEERAEAD